VEEDAKLISSEPRHEPAIAHYGDETPSYLVEQLITYAVAKSVVDDLKSI
jgi:hypothetical protein